MAENICTTTTANHQDSFQITPFNYHDSQIRVVTDTDGNPWWVAKDVCDILGFADHNSAVRSHLDEDEKGVLPAQTLGGIQKMLSVNESGLYALIFKAPKPEARPFRKWVTSEVLPTIRKTGKYDLPQSKPAPAENIECQMIALKYSIEILQPSEVSKLQMIHAIHAANGLPTLHLPQYAENVRVTFSATDLLKKNSCELGARAFNKLMIANGFMEMKERKSKKGVKRFKALTESGLSYGQNDASPSNPRETQPHYFEDTFTVLYELLTASE